MDEPVLTEGQSEEANYSGTVEQAESQRVRRKTLTKRLSGMDASTKISWLPNHKVFLEAKNQ